MGEQARRTALALFTPSASVEEYRKLLSDMSHIARSRPAQMSAGQCGKALARWQVVDFSSPWQAWNILVNGWSECGWRGIWTDGRMSTLQLEILSAERWITLRFVVRPFVNAHWPRQHTTISANGREVGAWDITRKGRQSLDIDIDLDRTGRRIELQFVHRMAASPSALGLSSDERMLSLRFRRLYLLPKPRSRLDALRFRALHLLSAPF